MRNVTGQVDETRMKPASRGSPELWRVGSGRVRRISKPRGSGRVGSGQEVFKISRVGSGRVRRFSNLADRVGSGQDVSKFSRVGSGQDVLKISRVGSGRVSTRPARFDPTREKPCSFVACLSHLAIDHKFLWTRSTNRADHACTKREEP